MLATSLSQASSLQNTQRRHCTTKTRYNTIQPPSETTVHSHHTTGHNGSSPPLRKCCIPPLPIHGKLDLTRQQTKDARRHHIGVLPAELCLAIAFCYYKCYKCCCRYTFCIGNTAIAYLMGVVVWRYVRAAVGFGRQMRTRLDGHAFQRYMLRETE